MQAPGLVAALQVLGRGSGSLSADPVGVDRSGATQADTMT